MCLIWSLSVSSAISPINYAHLSASQMQSFLKAENSEKTLHSGKGKGSVPFWRTKIQCSCTLTPYVGPKCLQHHIFLLNPTRGYYYSLSTFIRIKNVFPFYSSYCISYNNTLESFRDEIVFFHAKLWCDVRCKAHLALFSFWKATRHV